jgi:hypothetical protein
MSQAVFGFLGVFVGAVVTGLADYLLQKRRERVALRTARRMLPLELREAETTARSSCAARAKIASSLAASSPYSRTCTASWFAVRSRSATIGDRALSMRNLNPTERAAIPLADRRGCVLQRLADVLCLEVREGSEDLSVGHPVCGHSDDGGHWDA